MEFEKKEVITDVEFHHLYEKSRNLIDNARSSIGRMANSITVYTNYFLGQYIVEQEQHGTERAKYGARIIDSLSAFLTKEYGRGFSRSNVAGMRQFYLAYKDREDKFASGRVNQESGIVQSRIGQLDIAHEKMPFQLSWTHYQLLMHYELHTC